MSEQAFVADNAFDAFLVNFWPAYGEHLARQKALGLYPPPPEVHYLYAVQDPETLFVKIGFTTRPKKHLKVLNINRYVPLQVIGVWIIPERVTKVEVKKKKKLKDLHKSGDWFFMTKKSVVKLVKIMRQYERVAIEE